MLERKEIEERVKAKDTSWFESIYYGDSNIIDRKEYSIVYDQNYGDGNDYFVAIEFKNHPGLYVLLEGTYSSWDSPHWDKVTFAQPYEHKETRYKTVTLDYIRDLKIESVLGDTEEK